VAEQDDGAERSQEPTQRRLDEARREGRILTSREMLTFAAMAAGTLVAVVLPSLAPWAATRWAAHLRLGPVESLDSAVTGGLYAAMTEVLAAGLIVAVPVALTALLAQAGMGGLRLTLKSAGFKANRMNPLAGLGRMVSLKALVELAKAVAKVALLGAVAGWVLWDGLAEMTALWAMAPGDASAVLAGLVLRLFVATTLVLGVIGAADLFWEAHQMRQSLRMTLDEVKRENKEDNGSPEVKGRLRRLQMEASRRGARERAALADVPQASVVVTNPTHFAVALRYAAGETEAPVVLAMGKGPMALRVIAQAERSGIPVLRMPPLARALYFTGDIGQPIREGLYEAVAAILAHVWRIERGLHEAVPDVDLPADMRFDAGGRPEA
jgi:flagellar biosynthesis protein FlhB